MEEKIRGKYTRFIGIMLVIALFVFGSIYTARRGNSMDAGLRFDPDAFIFPEQDGTFTQVEYAEISGLEYIEKADSSPSPLFRKTSACPSTMSAAGWPQ